MRHGGCFTVLCTLYFMFFESACTTRNCSQHALSVLQKLVVQSITDQWVWHERSGFHKAMS